MDQRMNDSSGPAPVPLGGELLEELFSSLELTDFGQANVAEALRRIPREEHSRGWREGEALAQAWLTDHKDCDFPWPFNRDLRHHGASLPGAELVGFTGTDGEPRFAFGQVKTSKEAKHPPQVVNQGDKSLINQALQTPRRHHHQEDTGELPAPAGHAGQWID